MADMQRTKGNGGHVQRPTDVFGAMRGEVDRLFERFEHDWTRLPSLFTRGLPGDAMMLELDVHENAQQFTIEADLPGVDEKDVTVTLANGLLCIKGEKKSAHEEKTESYYLSERSYGAFERSMRLPGTVDDSKLEAKFDKGVLRIIAPKKPEAVRAEKKIAISK